MRMNLRRRVRAWWLIRVKKVPEIRVYAVIINGMIMDVTVDDETVASAIVAFRHDYEYEGVYANFMLELVDVYRRRLRAEIESVLA